MSIYFPLLRTSVQGGFQVCCRQAKLRGSFFKGGKKDPKPASNECVDPFRPIWGKYWREISLLIIEIGILLLLG